MTIQTKKKLWRCGFFLLPLVTLFLPYVLFAVRGWNITANDMDITFIVLYGGYAFHTLLALSQLFLSLRILWFQKENRSQFSCRFHTIRFWVAFIFFVSIITIVWLFIFHDDSLNLVIQLSYIYFFSSFFYFIFCVLVNLVNLGHWIYTKIPRKPKEETPKEKIVEESPAHKYKWELEKSAIKKWTAIVLVACLLLCAGYLFGYDYNLPTVTTTTLSQTQVESFLQGEFTYKRDMEATHVVNNDTFEGVIHYRALVTDPANARVLLDTAKTDVIYRDLSTHYTFDSIDAEAVIPPCYYTPLVKKWGYGWFDRQGNLYADRFGKEKAENVPNYRRYFRIIVRKENAVFDYLIFTNQTNQLSVIHAVREICNTL